MPTDARHELELLREQVEVMRGVIQDLRDEKKVLEVKLADALYRLYHGLRSEKIDPKQLRLFVDDLVREAVQEVAEAHEDPPERKSTRRNGRRPLPEHLERERIVLDLPDEEKICPCCREAMDRIGEEVTEQVDYQPALFKVKQFVRPKYACKHSGCRGTVRTASLPPMPIEKGRPAAGLLAHVVVAKYVDHLPLYRQAKIYARHGLDLHRSTLCGWTDAIGDLLRPIVMAMWRRLKAGGYLQADETPIRVLDVRPGKAHRAYLWGYGVPGGEVVFDFSLTRSAANPKRMLEGYRGHLQADRYPGYNFVEKQPAITRFGCMAHVRRRFVEARDEQPDDASFVLAAIQLLYRAEAAARGKPAEVRRRVRQEKAAPILDVLERTLEDSRETVLPKSAYGEAVAHALDQWDDLVRYTGHGEVEIDNNGIENAMRPVALGRKNFLFVGSPQGGDKAALLFSLVTSCQRIGIEPWAYLKDVIDRVSTHPMSRVDELTPLGWKNARAARAE
jgi:transposase